ncbi:MAG: hypothetical protein ABSH25_11750, partial [Syntrophorhabdales bacterium]
MDERPVQKVGDVWALTAPADIFQLIAHRLAKSYLERFKVAFRNVFGGIDPKVELPPDKWFYYDIKGARGHSDWLRSGMAETLLLISERGSGARLDCVPPAVYVDEVVRDLPGLDNDWRTLASIRDQYARLMEAAPDPLLCSLERLLEAKPDDVPRLFVEGEGIFGGGAMHTGVLWGLEVLAWSPDFLSRVTLILAELARLDPGGRMANRPIGSLYEIFLPWHPGTYASIQERLAAIDLILDREPDIGWKLLAKLLPTGSPSASFMTAKPHWRDFGDPPEDARTWRGWAQYASAIVERAVDRLGNDVGRWGNILDSLRVINSAQQKRIIDMLQSVAQESPQYVKTALWEKLRDFVYQHRTFRAAEWALSEDILNRLEAILPLLAPGDPVARFSWLFDDWLPEIPSGEEDIDLRKKQVEELRQQAVQEILETKGTEGLVELGTRSKYPGLVAVAALPLMKNMDQARLLCQQAIVAGKEDLSFAAQVSGQARRLYGE